MKKLIYIFIIIAIGFASCVDPYAADSTFVKDVSALPAASYMESTDSINVSTWVQLLKYTDLFNTMNLAANYTCFVPNNAAMQVYLAKKGVSSVTDLSMDDAVTLVKYHTIPGSLYSAVSFEEGVIPDTTATGDYLSSSFLDNGGAVQINQEATIIKTIKANNAYIQILNATLTPVTETIWNKMEADNFSIFRQALESTGNKDMLNTVSAQINGLTYKYHYTLFAVPDSVYHARGINDLTSLATFLKAGSDYTSPTNKLNIYVAYHLFNQQISYSSLANFAQSDTKRSKNYATMAANQLLNINELNQTLYINTDTAQVQFLAVNRNCKNGVVHVVDGIMPVQIPKPTTFKWELTDYPILASTLPKYRVSGLTTGVTYLLDPIVTTCYNWLTIPESRPGLAYEIASKNDATRYKALNYDYLVLNLGTYGWVEMTTPTIVAGKYTVTIEHYNPLAAAAQGKIWFIVDGAYLGTAPIATQGNSKTTSQFLKTTVGTITFSTSATHKVRILAADSFTSELDCLTFTPSL